MPPLMYSIPHSGLRSSLVALLLTVIACGGDDCIIPPCFPGLAIEVTVTVEPSGAPATGAFFAVTGAVTGGGPCENATCEVLGGAGTYDLDISAPGYQTVHQRVVVTGTDTECGCPTVRTERLTVALPSA